MNHKILFLEIKPIGSPISLVINTESRIKVALIINVTSPYVQPLNNI